MKAPPVLILFSAIVPCLTFENVPKVTIANGELEGTYGTSRGGRTFSAFMGIPYANSPTMFEEAEGASNWDGVRIADKIGSVCPQFDPLTKSIQGAEDCLSLNVFKPSVDPNENMPVLVFIHGGGFLFGGSNMYGADYLIDEDILLVTINYRLGPYGFLSMGDEVLPGNLGLKDQVLALEWVQKNIGFFGGDPSAVTIAGESAGGASVGLHVASPLSRGLFHRAICSSSSGLNRWTFAEDIRGETHKLAKRLHCPISSSEELKACLKGKSFSEMLMPSVDSLPIAPRAFIATLEPPGVVRPFLASAPRDLYKSGNVAKVPLLITVNKDEGLLFHSAAIMKFPQLQHLLNTKWLELAPTIFHYDGPNFTPKRKNEISTEILKFYFSNQEPIVSETTFQNLTNVFSDAKFVFGAHETALEHAKYDETYAAMLAFDGIWSHIFPLGYDKVLGMSHADDLQYLFTNFLYPRFEPDSDTLTASQRLVRIYAKFVKFGNPNLSQDDAWKPITSEEQTEGTIKWAYLTNREMHFESDVLKSRMDFWNKVYSDSHSDTIIKEEL